MSFLPVARASDNATIVLGKPCVIEYGAPVEYYDGDACVWKNRRWPEGSREAS